MNKVNFRLILVKLVGEEKWGIVSNPKYNSFTKSLSNILLNEANNYAEYKNCGCVHRMIRVKDSKKYFDEAIDESCLLDPSLFESSVIGNNSELQIIVNSFNYAYIKAYETSLPKDWGQAALIGRQIVNELVDKNLVEDNYSKILNENKKTPEK